MFCEVIRLRRDGKPIRATEWESPVFGNLATYVAGGPDHHAIAEPTPIAALYDKVGVAQHERLVILLIGPELVEATLDGMVWKGQEFHLDRSQGKVVLLEQLWLVRPRGEHNGPLPPFDWKGWIEQRRAKQERP